MILKRIQKFLLLMLSGLALAAHANESPENVLFVGNSFTYYNNSLHNHYGKLLDAANDDGEAIGVRRILTISGGKLPEHERGLRQRLEEQDWDVVILQGYSNGPITPGTAEPFQEAARAYAKDIRAAGAEPVFFMTWAYTGEPDMTAKLDAAYTAIGAELDAGVVPVGLAFATSLARRPELELITADNKHPTLAGTYLAACTFYAVLQGRSPEGLRYAAGLSESDAGFLQKVAWTTWQNYASR
jgi:hypothetical protein